MKEDRADIYQRITDQIVEAIEKGADRFQMPWHTSAGYAFSPINAQSQRPYRGINVLVLWAAAQKHGYKSGAWGTYKQWQELGAHVRRGEKATSVVFWKFSDVQAESDTGEISEEKSARRIPFAKEYWVFNADQVEGYSAQPVPELPEFERRLQAERFFVVLRADVRYGGNQAFYRSDGDYIQLPPFSAFRTAAGYYSTMAHETTHWTGAAHRLNRDLSGRFGSAAYAGEELVAELGAAFLCADLSIENEPRADHAAYISGWLALLRNDKKAIFTASSKAQAAVDWMHARQVEGMQAA
jgi:antirestriction protein ArdC